jgi:hypothetical protein
MDDRVLAAEVKAVLVGIQSDVKVWASGGAVRVVARTHEGRVKALTLELEEASRKVGGVESVEVHVELAIGTVWGL